jgi:hypothetical protein
METSDFIKKDWKSENIIDTISLIEKIIQNDWKIDLLCNSLIITKWLRALTKSIDNNSKSNDKLVKVWIAISVIWAIATACQAWIAYFWK